MEGKLGLTSWVFFIEEATLRDYQVLKKAKTEGIIYNAAPVRPEYP